MRVVSGDYGGRPLKTLEGLTTRPTTDKVRGAIFNMIGPYFKGERVLDLYAGSGALSIEAVSRGAGHAVLVEKDRRAQAIICDNIAMTKEESAFSLLKMSAKQALAIIEGPFDIVFLDPPYARQRIPEDISVLHKKGLLSESAMLICETDKQVSLPDECAGYTIWKQKVYASSQVTIYVA